MAKLCPACSKANPATANFCYFDGRHLSLQGQEGPLQISTLPLPIPFHFPDGQRCANFNELALACDARWDEARGLLADGTWHSFFTAIGRIDLAVAAKQAVKEPDLDVGLSQLLEKLPADPGALRRPELALPTTAEHLGSLTPGTDHRFELLISNRGLLVLRGMATTNCEWLSFGDETASALKMFQTRGIYSLPVRVLGNKLRAGAKPLQGEIVIDTNGGAITVPVRAYIPVRPFPNGAPANNVLAGAKSPRELAHKAKANPLGAATLFEQGAVKAWYAINGWTYPVEGTQASGKCAVQQFFEALGLTKPPHLEIDTQRLHCKGRVGQRDTKYVTISTREPRVVYAQGWSNQPWLKVGAGKAQGNKVTLPLHIEVPPHAGETVHADVTIHGNGNQLFVVPVTLAVLAAPALAPAIAEVKAPIRRLPLAWLFAGVGVLLLLAIPVTVAAFIVFKPLGTKSINVEVPGPKTSNPQPPVAKTKAWWEDIPGTNLTALVAELKGTAPDDETIIADIAAKEESQRGDAYEKLAAAIPKLLGNPKGREPLRQLVAECYVFDPSDWSGPRLLRALLSQVPRRDTALRPEMDGEELKRGLWLLQVCFAALDHDGISKHPEKVRKLTRELEGIFGTDFDPKAPPDKLKAQAEKLLAERLYRNTLPTAEKSLEHALKIRAQLIEMFPRHLAPADRIAVDVDLIAIGLSMRNDAWPDLEPVLVACLDSTDPAVRMKITDLYKKADQALVPKMEKVLATQCKAVEDSTLTKDQKLLALQRWVANAKVSPEERLAQLRSSTTAALAVVKAKEKKTEVALLQDTVRLSHASTLAAALFHKDGGLERFDNLAVAKVPEIEQPEPAKPDDAKLMRVGAQPKPFAVELTEASARDPRHNNPFGPPFYSKEFLVTLKAGRQYSIVSSILTSHLRVEDPKKNEVLKEVAGDGRVAPRIVFEAKADGDYRLVAITTVPGKPVTFVIQIQLHLSEFLTKLADKQSTVRSEAFKGLSTNVANDLGPRQAEQIAKYLLSLEQQDERDAATANLGSFTKCRQLLLALADMVGNDNVKKETAEAIIGGLLEQKLRFAGDEGWRSKCEKILLQRALDLTASGLRGTDQAAEILANLYKEQGKAFGMTDPAFLALTRPTQVLESVIKHVAAKAAKQNSAGVDKAYLDHIDRHLLVAQFLANNDLEHQVYLQRTWIVVLRLYLQVRVPDQAKGMEQIQQALIAYDLESSGAVDQLRAGEESVLGIWALAHQLKER